MRRTLVWLIGCAALAALLVVPAQAQPNCSAYSNATLMEWPEEDPLWAFCFRRPKDSTPNPNGSGLEIMDVWYNGHKVMERGHVPVLNVEYAPGGCGCFRDWTDSEVVFEAIGSPCVDGYCETTEPPRAVCDCAPDDSCDANPNNNCNRDLGDFRGVASEKYFNRLVLSSQMSAGWYRYGMKWTFFLDGRIRPEFNFSATPSSCLDSDHFHHVYYRFDFDIDGDGNDLATINRDMRGSKRPAMQVGRELSDRIAPGEDFSVYDTSSGRGYRIIPGGDDHDLTASFDAAPFSVADYWVLAYDPAEIDDPAGGCATSLDQLVNEEDVYDQDLVFWYRAGTFDLSGDYCACHRLGPTLVPIGDW
jgi:hypothetical protein